MNKTEELLSAHEVYVTCPNLTTPFSAFTVDPSRKTGDPPRKAKYGVKMVSKCVKMRQNASKCVKAIQGSLN